MSSCAISTESGKKNSDTDCCSVSTKSKKIKTKAKCIVCGKDSKAVGKVTVIHMLKNEYLINLKGDHFYYCDNPDCKVVYFSEEPDVSFTKDQVRIRIGIKEKEEPQHVCYCFDYTVQSISDEITTTGNSKAAIDIAQKIKEKLCACEVKNPAGKCCLGSINKIIKHKTEIFS